LDRVLLLFRFVLMFSVVFLQPPVVMLVAYGARGMLDFFPGCMVN
jgi:hypothetical protein